MDSHIGAESGAAEKLRVHQLEVEVARLQAELDTLQGADPSATSSRLLAMAASTVDAAMVDLEQQAAVSMERAHQAEATAEAAIHETDAAKAAAAQVTIAARQELEEARAEARKLAAEARAQAEEVAAAAAYHAERLRREAQGPVGDSLAGERERLNREIEALTGVREALMQERLALEKYHDKLRDQVEDLAQAMVSFMGVDASPESVAKIQGMPVPEIPAPPVPAPGEWDDDDESWSDSDDLAEVMPLPVSQPKPQPEPVASPEAISPERSEPEAVPQPEPVTPATEQASGLSGPPAPPPPPSTFLVDPDPADWTPPQRPVPPTESARSEEPAETGEFPPREFDREDDDAPLERSPAQQSDPQQSSGFESTAQTSAEDALGALPISNRPIVEPIGTDVTPAPYVPREDDVVEAEIVEDPWRDVDPSEGPVNSRVLFGGPIQASVLAAERDENSDLFAPARPGELEGGPTSSSALFARSGRGDQTVDGSGSSEEFVDSDPDAEDQFVRFLNGDKDDDSRSWLLRSDDS